MKRKLQNWWWKIRTGKKWYRFERKVLIVWYWITRPYWRWKHDNFDGTKIGPADDISVTINGKPLEFTKYTMNPEQWLKKLDYYLKSIGGVENGYFGDWRPRIYGSWMFSSAPGWNMLVYELTKEIVEMGWNRQICQVKEKFGGLRYYPNACSNEVWEKIYKAEQESYTICQHCGNYNAVACTYGGNPYGWIVTLCEDCRKTKDGENYKPIQNEEDVCDKDIDCKDCVEKECFEKESTGKLPFKSLTVYYDEEGVVGVDGCKENEVVEFKEENIPEFERNCDCSLPSCDGCENLEFNPNLKVN